MNELVYEKNNEAMTDSLRVSGTFGKRHDRIIRAIENIINDSPQKWGKCFKVSSYKDDSGRKNKMYLMNEKAYSVLVMGFTGKKALDWKWKYAEAFELMKDLISEKSTAAWLETRQQGKLTRKAETDVLKQLVEYAKEQGSKNSQWLYKNYTALANKLAGVTNRDNATVMQLNNLTLAEHVILTEIKNGILAEKHYKEIYQGCKARLEALSDIAYLETA